MLEARTSQIVRSISVLIAACLFALPAHAKYSGGTGEPNDPYQIATAADLIALGNEPNDYDKHFILTADIDLDPKLPGRKVFDKAVIAPDTDPTKEYFQGTPFTGVFDGDGHRVSHLTITGKDYLGLFGFGQWYSGAEVKDLGVVDVNINGSGGYVGGLVGLNGGSVTQCYSTGMVTGKDYVGGLVGGITGRSVVATISNCYSTGVVTGKTRVGGLVGTSLNAAVTHCYSTGAVSGSSQVGGLVGYVESNWDTMVAGCFWNAETSGRGTSAGGTGLTTDKMQDIQTYQSARWDFVGQIEDGTSEIWQMPEGGGYPVLAIFSGYLPPQLRGLGTLEDPYLISNALELGAIVHYRSRACYRLAASIDLSGVRWGTAVIPSFAGTFDGNGLTISHLTITGESYLGLFGRLEWGAEVRNLGVVDVNINGSGGDVGGLVGWNEGAVTRCYSTGKVSGTSTVGGLIAMNLGRGATQCYSMVAVSGNGYVGGLVGLSGRTGGGGRIADSYSTGAVSGAKYVGGLVGSTHGEEVTRCYSTGAVMGTGLYVGGLVGDNDSPTQCFWDTQTSGQASSAGGTGKTTAEMHDPNTFRAAGWDFVGQADGPSDIWAMPEGGGYPILWWQLSPWPNLPTFSGGMGEPNDPYVISTAMDLSSIGCNPRLMRCHFKLVADLDLTGLRFYPMGDVDCPYGGVFDGNGHTISHLTIKGESYLGLFGMLGSGAEVKNLGVVDANLSGSDGYVGGLVGHNYSGSVTNCYSTGVISGTYRVGGLVGSNESGTVTQCYSTGTVSGNDNVGGLVGWNYEATVTDCHSTGTVSSKDSVGGLVGWVYSGDVTQSYSTGAVIGTGGAVGGLVGSNSGTLTDCYSTGAVSGGSSVGGLVGSNSGTLTDCDSTGAVGGDSQVGGLVGSNSGTLTDCYSTGTVTGTGWSVGGLVGKNNRGTLTECYSTAAVRGYASVGGLVGRNDGGTVTQCYSTSAVNGVGGVGGLVGENYRGTVSQCYSTGAVKGNWAVGGLVGENDRGTVTQSFWDIQTSGQAKSAAGTGKTTAQMQTAKTFLDAGWDFVGETKNGTEDLWWIREGKDYPRLWWELIPGN